VVVAEAVVQVQVVRVVVAVVVAPVQEREAVVAAPVQEREAVVAVRLPLKAADRIPPLWPAGGLLLRGP
jgi:hypothetical protein